MLFHFRIFMNWQIKTPFILFALCFVACLLSQNELYGTNGRDECWAAPQSSVNHHESLPLQKEIVDQSLDDDNQQNQHKISSLPHKDVPRPCNKRLLQTSVTTSNYFISGSTAIFKTLLLISRDLILIGIFTNTIDIFLPFILLTETFLMVGLWTCQKHYLTVLYSGVFNSYWDLFNAVRLISQPSVDTSNLPQLSQYGFSPLLLFNLSGEFLVALLLLAFTILSRVTAVCLKYEKLRRMSARLRPVWNGFFFAIVPRVATFTGLHWRLVGVNGGFDAVNGIVCSVLSVVLVFYFVALLIQTRRVNEKIQRLDQGAQGLGLVKQIDIKKDFEFDCIRFSAIYIPCMNYLRVLLYCLPIGIFWDYYYLSYGGPITAQLLIIMAEVSSSNYRLRRDRILFPIQQFLLLIIHLCMFIHYAGIITVGLAESVQHSEASQVAETLLFSLLFIVLGSSLAGVGASAWKEAQEQCKQEEGEPEESAQALTRQLGKSAVINEAKRPSEGDSESSNQDDIIIDHPSMSFKPSEHKLRIKKVRKGKII